MRLGLRSDVFFDKDERKGRKGMQFKRLQCVDSVKERIIDRAFYIKKEKGESDTKTN